MGKISIANRQVEILGLQDCTFTQAISQSQVGRLPHLPRVPHFHVTRP